MTDKYYVSNVITCIFFIEITYIFIPNYGKNHEINQRICSSLIINPFGQSEARIMLEECVHANAEFVAKITAHVDAIILSPDLVPVSTTMDITTTTGYATNMASLTAAARSACRDLDPSNDLLVLRMGTRKNEVVVGVDDAFTIITVQMR